MSTELTWQLVDPWTKSGWLILGGSAALLTLLTLWTYWGVRGVGTRKLLTVLGLRLLALVIACLLLTRPGLAMRDTTPVPSTLLILVDQSLSMSIRDGGDGKTRWEAVRRIWRSDDVQRALGPLQNEQLVTLVYYQGAEEVGKLNLEGQPQGKRTHIGVWLQRLRDLHLKDSNLRGLILFSDGIDNGDRNSTLKLAGSFRDLNCPIYTFQVGKTGTSRTEQDIAVVAVNATPSTAAIKAPLVVTAQIEAHGIDAPNVVAQLFAKEGEGEEKLVATKKVQLTRAPPLRNEVRFDPIHPEKVGELKLTVKVVPLPKEANVFNNEMSTYVNVTKDGVSVLWVEARPRAWEPVFAIRHALARDPRFRVTYTEPPPAGFDPKTDWYQFRKRAEEGQQYDVIVIGDISARQFTGSKLEGDNQVRVNSATIDQVHELVDKKGVGLLMLGGRQTFWNSDWQDPRYKSLTDLLPVVVPQEKLPRINGPVKVTLPQQGQTYLTKLDDKPGGEFWQGETFEPFDSLAPLGKPLNKSTVYLQSEAGEAILVGGTVAGTRVLMFGGDTTWKAWRRSPEAVAAYERFWKQMILWLAKQEEAEGSLWIRPDTRRELAGHQKRVGFRAGITGKGGTKSLTGAKLWAQVYGPDKKKLGNKMLLPMDNEGGRSFTPILEEPGEYEIVVSGEVMENGKLLKDEKKARFMAFAEDQEMATWAADEKLMEQLSRLSGGQVIDGEDQLVALLKTLGERRANSDRTRVDKWPDWSQKPWSDAAPDQLQALWGSGALASVVTFVLLICAEWVLRRRWGLV